MSTALLDADGAAPLWKAVAAIAEVRAIVVAPSERWFADAAVNPMLVVAERRGGGVAVATRAPRLLRLRVPTEVAARACGIEEIAQLADERYVDRGGSGTRSGNGSRTRSGSGNGNGERIADGGNGERIVVDDDGGCGLCAVGDCAARAAGVVRVARGCGRHARAPRRARRCAPRCHDRRQSRLLYSRARAAELRLEAAYLPCLSCARRSPSSPAPIAVAPDESPIVALTLPPDPRVLRRAPRIAKWLRAHADDAAHD